MNYEMRKFGRRKFWMPEDWRLGELVTWEERDIHGPVAPRVGVVTDIRLLGVDARWDRRGWRCAYFTMDILSDSGPCCFTLRCVMWKEHSQALGDGPGAVWCSHSDYTGWLGSWGAGGGTDRALILPRKVEGEAA